VSLDFISTAVLRRLRASSPPSVQSSATHTRSRSPSTSMSPMVISCRSNRSSFNVASLDTDAVITLDTFNVVQAPDRVVYQYNGFHLLVFGWSSHSTPSIPFRLRIYQYDRNHLPIFAEPLTLYRVHMFWSNHFYLVKKIWSSKAQRSV
jgi:hypothetical protein